MNPPVFKRASREAAKLKIGVSGPSGAGKTLGALALARGLVGPEGRIAVLDTENGSASLYSDRYEFDVLEIRPPYLTAKYEEGVKAAIAGGYAAVVIDSISHQWEGDGGILQRKEETDARGGNHFSNWAPFTKEHNRFRALLLEAPIHLVATMRSKMAYAQETTDKKTQIKKVGLAPIQREGMEYEFTVSFDVQMDHRALASKDRTDLFGGLTVDLLDEKVAGSLLAWLSSAVPAAPPAPPSVAPTVEHDTPLEGKPLAELLTLVAKAGVKKSDFPSWYEQITGRKYDRFVYGRDVDVLADAARTILAGKGAHS